MKFGPGFPQKKSDNAMRDVTAGQNKKIVFLTANCTWGKCGVGDYSLLLAKCFERNGSKAAVIGLRDRYCENITLMNSPVESISIPVSLSSKQADLEAKAFLERFKPDFVSLQLVTYGFHAKGMPVFLPRRLRRLIGKYKVHIMIHEIWIGWEKSAVWKERAYGYVQKKIIRNICKELRPIAINTSNRAYQDELTSVGIPCDVSPIFTNIEKTKLKQPAAFLPESKAFQRVLPLLGDQLVGVFFGAFQDGWPIETFAADVKRVSDSYKPRIVLISVGRQNAIGLRNWELLTRCVGSAADFFELGEMSDKDLSGILDRADFGVTNTSPSIMGKSGAVAAMKAHGLPVVAPRPLLVPVRPNPSKFEFEPGVFKSFKDFFEDWIVLGKRVEVVGDSVECVMDQMKVRLGFPSH